MIIKIEHQRLKGVKVCSFCSKPLEKGIALKRGTCMTCYNKYCIKTKLAEFF